MALEVYLAKCTNSSREKYKYEEPPKNFGNSSTPPSQESRKDEIIRRTKSFRKPFGKKPGGQPGHKGDTLEMSDVVDAIVEERTEHCDECGESLAGCETEFDYTPGQYR